MSSGFWAGAVPPWAYAVGACLFILAVLLGMWAGYGRGFRHGEEEARWAREQAAARRVQIPPGQTVVRWRTGDPPPEVAHEAWLAHEDQALTLANDRTLGGKLHDIHGGPGEDCWCGYVGHDPPDPITTGEIQAITDETDAMVARWKADNDLWMAEHGLSGGEA